MAAKNTLGHYFNQYEASHTNKWNRVCHGLGIPLIIFSLGYLLYAGSDPLGWGLFALGWAFQFLGHLIERSMPEFLRNPLFLFLGPLYFLNKIGIIKVKRP